MRHSLLPACCTKVVRFCSVACKMWSGGGGCEEGREEGARECVYSDSEGTMEEGEDAGGGEGAAAAGFDAGGVGAVCAGGRGGEAEGGADLLVEVGGVEPPTFCVQSRRSPAELHPRIHSMPLNTAFAREFQALY